MKKIGKLYFAVCFLFLLAMPAKAYIDPSVATYAVQAIAGVAVAVGAVEQELAADAAVEKPERYIHALDFLNGVGIQKGIGQEQLSLVVPFQGCNGILFFQLKRNHMVRL